MKSRMFVSLLVLVLTLIGFNTAAWAQESAEAVPEIEIVTMPSPGSPLVAVRLLFKVGSIHDPEGLEGLAALTASMVGEAGTSERSYSELIEALYPMAASINVNVDREVTTFTGLVHRDKLAEYTSLLNEVLLKPGFSESDFSRNKEQLVAYLTTTMRATNDELLGLEAIQQVIFEGHPYGHSPAGTVEALEKITLKDVQKFYSTRYTQSNLMLGVGGGYPEDYVDSLAEALSALPVGKADAMVELPAPAKIEGHQYTIIEKKTASVGIHFGYALPITRSDDDYFPLMVANSYLGEHRTFHGRLMQQLRGKRGLNYGDYSYIEYWDQPPFTSNPRPNVPRRQQFFSIWVRPVVPNTAHFAVRDALYEVDRLVEQGMTEAEFELTRDFLINYSKLWARTLSTRLGYLMDSRFYGTDYYIDEIDARLKALTLEEVNAAVRKYFTTANYKAVVVTDGAAAVQAYLEKGDPSPMEYNSEPEEAVKEDDKTIQKYVVNPTSFKIIPIAEMFQK